MAAKSKKHVGGKAKATRNEFTGIASAFVDAQVKKDIASEGQLAQALKAAEMTQNTEANRDKLREALKTAYEASKCPILTARVYISECIRICSAYFLTVPVTEGDSKKTVRKSGKEMFQGVSYDTAKRVASSIMAYNGKRTGKGKGGRKSGQKAAPKALDKAGIISLLDQVIDQVRTNTGFSASVLTQLIEARHAAIGKGVKVTATAELSRGQKAAATRRANEVNAGRTLARQSISHRPTAPVATMQ